MLAAFMLAAALGQGPTFVQLPSGGFVPCDHPLAIAAGLGCGRVPPATAPTPAPVPVAGPACDPRPDPYAEPDAAAACAAWERAHRPRPALPVFEVGVTYRDTYDVLRMTVLSVAPSLEGVPIVTAEYVQGPVGRVFSFRVTEGAPWVRTEF